MENRMQRGDPPMHVAIFERDRVVGCFYGNVDKEMVSQKTMVKQGWNEGAGCFVLAITCNLESKSSGEGALCFAAAPFRTRACAALKIRYPLVDSYGHQKECLFHALTIWRNAHLAEYPRVGFFFSEIYHLYAFSRGRNSKVWLGVLGISTM